MVQLICVMSHKQTKGVVRFCESGGSLRYGTKTMGAHLLVQFELTVNLILAVRARQISLALVKSNDGRKGVEPATMASEDEIVAALAVSTTTTIGA